MPRARLLAFASADRIRASVRPRHHTPSAREKVMTALHTVRAPFVMAFVATASLAVGATAAAQGVSRQAAAPARGPAAIAVEFEDAVAAARASAGQIGRQDMQAFGPGWSGGQLLWRPPAPVNAPIRNWPNLTVPFNVPTEGTYELVLRHTAAPDFATFRLFLDGQQVADIDGYSPTVAPRTRSLGQRTLPSGRHELVITVFGKAPSSTGFLVGLDRLDIRPLNGTATGVIHNPAADVGGQQPGAVTSHPPASSTMQAIKPGTITKAICAASPEACCPAPETNATGCAMVAQALLDIRIRSYVPPRFTELGNNYPWDTDWWLANVVSDVSVGGPFKVWPGCRFNVTQAANVIENNKSILEKAGALLDAWFSQWSSGIDSAKGFVSQGVADAVCDAVDDSQSCRSKLAPVVKAGINVGLASLGVPPDLPDVQQLRQNGIRYLAAEAASSAIGDPDILNKLPLDENARAKAFDAGYGKALDIFSTELNKVIPSPNFSSQKPSTWGHLEPAYAPHNAHLYVEVRVNPNAYPKYRHFLALNPKHKWVKLTLLDVNHVYNDKIGIDVPAFIPPEGVILPIELMPSSQADTDKDDALAQIPGVRISRKWLEQKFGISAADGFVRAGMNYYGVTSQLAKVYTSDWDLFYFAKGESKFRLLSFAPDVSLHWENEWTASVGTTRDAEAGAGVLDQKQKQLKNYYGRIDPAPRCDGQPNQVAFKQ
jgi:hypothetical protein